MLLSVIVPMYRVAAYLRPCLNSACALPVDEAEILCVDDASDDESAAIAQAYAARYPHARVLRHAKNLGLSAARNTGIAAAQGDYLLFLDGDDVLLPDAALSLARQAQAERLDVLQGAWRSFEHATGRDLPRPRLPEPTEVLPGDACLAAQCRAGAFEPMTVIRLYRRMFLRAHNLRMVPGLRFEDELFSGPALLLAERARVTDVLFYRYRRRPGSIMDGFARDADWCGHQWRVAQALTALAARPRLTPGQAALRRRAAAIALSIPKNIAAYGLKGAVRQQALAFTGAHKKSIARMAMAAGSPGLWAQGAALLCSLKGFLWVYGALRRL
ncbi:MAG: glycosyltransferase [Oscillospiraceae bacterium]|jgi:glycosyltransferase involved in cell wall biosynthesis|nr:glycosyltransferase [Oscillospiraceae bacterium]